MPSTTHEFEAAVLGGSLLGGVRTVERLIVDVGLRPEHFGSIKHRAVFAAMVALCDAGDDVDSLTVAGRLEAAGALERVGGRRALDELTVDVPYFESVTSYARRVKADAEWRARRDALAALSQAVERRDEAAFAEAESLLLTDPDSAESTWDADAVRHHVFEYLAGNGARPMPLPYPKLNELLGGGVFRGDVTFMSGWTSMGKSTALDGFLEWFAAQGLRVHLYMNEMALIMRALRLTASVAEVPFKAMQSRRLSRTDADRVVRKLNEMTPFSMTNCAGWTVEKIARHIKAKRWDVVGIDSMSLIPRRNREDLDRISQTISAIAQQADCHIFAVGLLSKRRAEAILPPPVEADIRDSSQIGYDAANVLFVHRDQQEEQITVYGETRPTGRVRKLPTGTMEITKARNGEPGIAYVRLNPQRMRFEELPDDPAALAA